MYIFICKYGYINTYPSYYCIKPQPNHKPWQRNASHQLPILKWNVFELPSRSIVPRYFEMHGGPLVHRYDAWFERIPVHTLEAKSENKRTCHFPLSLSIFGLLLISYSLLLANRWLYPSLSLLSPSSGRNLWQSSCSVSGSTMVAD